MSNNNNKTASNGKIAVMQWLCDIINKSKRRYLSWVLLARETWWFSKFQGASHLLPGVNNWSYNSTLLSKGSPLVPMRHDEVEEKNHSRTQYKNKICIFLEYWFFSLNNTKLDYQIRILTEAKAMSVHHWMLWPLLNLNFVLVKFIYIDHICRVRIYRCKLTGLP